jgi:hypothetical protein
MTQSFNQDVVINNTTSNVGLTVNQTGNNEGIQIYQQVNQTGLRVRKNGTGSGSALVSINLGSGYSIYGYQIGAGHCGVFQNDGGGYCLYLDQNSNRHALVVDKSGSGSGVVVLQGGEGSAISLSKSHTGSSNVLQIANSGSGYDVQGNGGNWRVGSQGDAWFSGVDVGCGKIYASNAAIAGGRVHIFQRGQDPVSVNIWCGWGLQIENPVVWIYAPFGPIFVARVSFSNAVTCPIIKVTPWLAGQYDERQMGLFNYSEQGHTNSPLMPLTVLEPQIVQVIPLPGTHCVVGFDVYFQYCEMGSPAVQAPYEVYSMQEGTCHDLVFDFEVLGCVCNPD